MAENYSNIIYTPVENLHGVCIDIIAYYCTPIAS